MNPRAWLGWATDRLARNRAVTRALLADPAEAIALVGSAGQLRHPNAALRALAGTVGGNLADLLAEPASARLHAALRSRSALTIEAEIRAVSRLIPVVASLTPTGLGGPAAVLRLRDRSNERRLEERLGQAQRLQAMGQLAGGIAHDFNNLLTAILGAADDLAGRATSAEDHEDTAQIRQSAERGAALVRQILAFGRQQTLQSRVLMVNDAVRGVSGLLERLLGSRVTLNLVLEEPGRRVCVDPTQLDQVLVNLAVNARDAMPDGGTLTLTTRHRLVLGGQAAKDQILPPGRYATIEIRDTGCGMPAEILQHIFEPFFTTRRDAGGTGLGLSTVFGIVTQSGGYLDVESTPGQGTCFRITLPRYEEPVPAVPPPVTPSQAAEPPPAKTTGTLLLVDDEAPVRRLAARALAGAGWRVISSPSAVEALEEDLTGMSCVVSDVIMPGMDGPSLVQHLRRDRPCLAAILMSGYADPAQRQLLAGANIRFLAKPFAMRELVEVAQRSQEKSQGWGDSVPPNPC